MKAYSRKRGFVPGRYPEHFSSAAGLMASVADIAAMSGIEIDARMDETRSPSRSQISRPVRKSVAVATKGRASSAIVSGWSF